MKDGTIMRYRRARLAQILHAQDRVGKLARQLTSEPVVVQGRTCRFGSASERAIVAHTFAHIVPQGEPTSDDVRADLLRKHIAYTKRSVGRILPGVPKPTGRVKDAKNYKAARTAHAKHTFAHTVDLQRTYTHKSAPFRPGGSVWAKCDRVGKRRLRGVVGLADKIALKGEITAALELVLGSR